jgi:cardiolipin synthase
MPTIAFFLPGTGADEDGGWGFSGTNTPLWRDHRWPVSKDRGRAAPACEIPCICPQAQAQSLRSHGNIGGNCPACASCCQPTPQHARSKGSQRDARRQMTDLVRAIVGNIHIVAIFLAANYALAAVCAVREIISSRTSQGSIAWLLSLLFFPFPVAIIYLVFGWKFFDDYSARRLQSRNARPLRAQDLKVIDRATTEAWPVLSRVAGVPFTSGNDAKLLIDGKATFDSIFAEISEAKRYLFVQFYIVRDDALGRELAVRLAERARAGVRVYLLYDDIGSTDLPRRYRDDLRAAGVKVAGFNQRHKFLRFYGPMRINYRNHRKIVVVDGKVAWTGGINVGVEYLGQDKTFGPWRDTHLRIAGPAALACALIFREDWEWATGDHLPFEPPAEVTTPGDVPALVMGTGPADKFESCAIAFTDVIAQARHRLWIATPYFVPDTDVRTALLAAVLRGVDVRIMLPSMPDHMTVWLASNAHADHMVRRGVSVYRYQPGFLHQKVVLVDDTITSVGSVNFDNRSFAINFEITVWMPHHGMVKAVEAMLEADFARCKRVGRDEASNRSYFEKLTTSGARLLSPIL